MSFTGMVPLYKGLTECHGMKAKIRGKQTMGTHTYQNIDITINLDIFVSLSIQVIILISSIESNMNTNYISFERRQSSIIFIFFILYIINKMCLWNTQRRTAHFRIIAMDSYAVWKGQNSVLWLNACHLNMWVLFFLCFKRNMSIVTFNIFLCCFL